MTSDKATPEDIGLAATRSESWWSYRSRECAANGDEHGAAKFERFAAIKADLDQQWYAAAIEKSIARHRRKRSQPPNREPGTLNRELPNRQTYKLPS